MDLTEFLAARLDEDEFLAREMALQGPPYGEHMNGRALREVETKRRFLDGHKGVHRCDWGEHRGGDLGPCRTLRILADVYSGHPDCREEWIP